MLAELQSLSAALCDVSLETRLQTFAHRLLGIKYGFWERGKDLETLDDFNYQLDLLDCLTYVEVVLALAKTHPSENFIDLLRHLHYAKGVPNFISSNHFMGVDWISNNKYILEDQTRNFGRNVQTAEAVIDKLKWLQMGKKISNIPEHLLPNLTPRLEKVPYIPTLELLDNQTRYFKVFPEYSIVCIVRPNWDLTAKIGTNVNISHLGFVFKDHVTRTLRFYHASGSLDHNVDLQLPEQVVTLDLCEYMAKYIDSPTIKGFNILTISPGYYYFN